LVAGVPNRVYVRVRNADSQPADLEGRIVDNQGREVAHVQTMQTDEQHDPSRGLGAFTFTPQPGNTYTLRSTTPGQTEVATALPEALWSSGSMPGLLPSPTVAMQVVTGVTHAGEPIRVRMYSSEHAPGQPMGMALLEDVLASERWYNLQHQLPVLVGLFAGGRLVAQQSVKVGPEGTEVQLTPATHVAGVLRVTAFELQDGQLRPLAERLIYRVPSE